ncbi:peptide ABC transporter permease [Salinarimonas ramus]|uniref:Peptide ABC transporter permease n=1 Tax=Salinarimonas ramus TaxID=690164 RepID=A0A917Q4Y5_9HYPH|nr:peptide ABC transporter permease [Salinarimonas ramus]
MRLWPQALAIALVMAAGVATLILGVGAHDSLSETRAAYYERNRFSDVFAGVTRAPERIASRIAEIDGVGAVETRTAKIALLDLPDIPEPASAIFVSLPDWGEQALDLITLRSGRTPLPGATREVVVSEPFAQAHGYEIGSTFAAILNGVKRELTIVGTALSPEFVYALGPWDLMPDDRRFGVVWMSRSALAAAYDLEGAFSDLRVRLLRGASESAVIEEIDRILAPYGGEGAHGRKDQLSHAFLDAELTQLEAMSRILPPIFLVVAAFLVNMTLARLITLEREQIGLMKALGYSNFAVGLHYLKFVAAIALIGAVIGSGAGTWLGTQLTRMYGDFFHFPFLIFRMDPATYLVAVGVTLLAAIVGALKAVAGVVRLAPAVAMTPPAPARYRRTLLDRLHAALRMPQAGVMTMRHLVRYPGRSLGGLVGIALATAILVGSFWSYGSIEFMIDVTFHRADRQDATITFVGEREASALYEIARLPGVMAAEPYRSVPAKLRSGTIERRVAITGKPEGADLSRVLDSDLAPVRLPESGLALSDQLADILRVETGDLIEVELMAGDRRTVTLPVAMVVEGYLGLMAYADIGTVNRLMREGALVSGVHLALDETARDDLFAELKAIPAASFVALQRVSLAKFRETLAQNLLMMVSIYATLAAIIAFGVVYNFARISLSEQGRELASLRVLGFTNAEISWILLSELAILVLLAQPVGWLVGYGFAMAMAAGFESELYRVPLVVNRDVYAWASLVVVGAALVSGLIVRRRIDRLDLIAVLKTRE